MQNEIYLNKINIEAIATRDIAMTMILPAAMAHQLRLAQSITALETAMGAESTGPQKEILALTTSAIGRLKAAVDTLLHTQEEIEPAEMEEGAKATAYRERVVPAMDQVRETADLLERLIDDDLWPLPKYREMLFIQ